MTWNGLQTHMWHIYTHFWGISDNIYGFGRPFFVPSFFTHPPIFYPSKTVFTCPNDGWTGLCIKLYSGKNRRCWLHRSREWTYYRGLHCQLGAVGFLSTCYSQQQTGFIHPLHVVLSTRCLWQGRYLIGWMTCCGLTNQKENLFFECIVIRFVGSCYLVNYLPLKKLFWN